MDNTFTSEMLIVFALLAPLISFFLCLIIPDRYSWIITLVAPAFIFSSCLSSIYLFYSASPGNPLIIELEWFKISEYSFNANITLNKLSILMLPLVTLISFLVHLYSIGHMAGDKNTKRYFAMLGFFTFSMLGIVLSDNLLLIFVFWELVGFSSYLLIGHWTEKPGAAQAARKAFIFNRIGDMGFLIGILIVWANTQTLNLNEILSLTEINSWKTVASLCMFCGVIGKSAQFPLFTWLPDAMEGPTPVSALIHAATMVAAGVFLLARVFPLFTEVSLTVVAIVGSVTALSAALSALNQYDIKKILAYSTISQLGLMVTAVGVGADEAAMLHLTTHAFFKACLFLSAGSIIYSLQQAARQSGTDFQDIRNLGGLYKKLPITFYSFIISAASLAGIPFFSGFTSKDSIITSVWYWVGDPLSWRGIILLSVFLVSFLTVLYTFRLTWFVFFAKKDQSASIVESPWIMRAPIVILASASLWIIISLNPFSPTGWFTSLIGDIQHSTLITSISAILILIAVAVAWFIYVVNAPSAKSINILQNGFKLDSLYQKIVGQPVKHLATAVAVVDKKWIDGLLHFLAYAHVSLAYVIVWFDKYVIDGSVNAAAWVAGVGGSLTRSFQGGKIQFYIFWAITGLIIFLFFVLI